MQSQADEKVQKNKKELQKYLLQYCKDHSKYALLLDNIELMALGCVK